MADTDESGSGQEDTDTGHEEAGTEDDRQEYYLSLIQNIVAEQKEFLDEKAALKQARRAPLHIDKEGNVVDFYGSGDKALETLRSFTEHQELYLRVIRGIVTMFKQFLGKKTALAKARKAPLLVNKDGEVAAYYGRGRNALEILVNQFESVLGEGVAQTKIQNVVSQTVSEEELELLPQRIRPRERDDPERNLLDRLIQKVAREAEHVAPS